MRTKQIMAVAKYEIKSQVCTFTYWSIIFWPIIIGIIFERNQTIAFHLSERSITTFNVDTFWGGLLPVFIFMMSISYVTMMASSVSMDKTNKISEMLLAIVDAKEQLYGKIAAIYALMLLHLSIYGIFIYFYFKWVGGKILYQIFAKTDPTLFIYLVLDAGVALFLALVWTTEIAAYVTDESQIAIAIIPVMLVLGTGTLVAFFLNEPNYYGSGISLIRIYGDVVLSFPPIGALLMPTLLANHSVNLFEAYLNLVIQLVVILILLKHSIRQYRIGLLTIRKTNPFLAALRTKI